MDWYLKCWKNYAVVDGRAHRTEYWMFILFNTLVYVALSWGGRVLGLSSTTGGGAFAGLYSLAALVPGIAVGVRRMHDTGHSGWWYIFPLVNLFFAVSDGDRGDNEYGPDPKAAA